MSNNRIGELRRSSVVTTFGPGSVVDFRADGGAVSAVTAGLEEWDRNFRPVGLLNPQKNPRTPVAAEALRPWLSIASRR
jgi:hypothetical protein